MVWYVGMAQNFNFKTLKPPKRHIQSIEVEKRKSNEKQGSK